MLADRVSTRQLGRYWRTARHLRPVQVVDRLRRRFDWHRQPGFPAVERRPIKGTIAPPVRRPVFGASAGSFCFLGQQLPAGGGNGWEPAGLPRLWRYHLHYFDHFSQDGWDAALAADWARENPPGVGTGWEPYPLSRRIPNWILARLASGAREPWADESLARQADSLSRQVEYHLLGNHLLANLRALLFAGCYFAGAAADQWREKALEEWDRELDRQFFPDGGHEERSPMYHSLILADLLDLIGLAEAYPAVLPLASVRRWRLCAGRMLGWLRRLCHPDGEIAFFQDTALGMASSAPNLFAAGASLGVPETEATLDGSGYVRLESRGAVLLGDVGEPGPAHQPGHAHAGALSLEVSLGKQRLLVNTGTSTYEAGRVRDDERSTAAHNTFQAGQRDQSEMWAAFRIGARARLIARRKTANAAEASLVDAAGVELQRRMERTPEGFRLRDAIVSTGVERVDWYFHLHPSVQARFEAGVWLLQAGTGEAVRLRLDAALASSLEAGWWSPAFGTRIPSWRIRAQWTGRCPAEFHHFLELP